MYHTQPLKAMLTTVFSIETLILISIIVDIFPDTL